MANEVLPMFPVYLLEEGVQLPEKGRYYVVAKNGIFIRKEGVYGSALVPADGIPWLKEVDAEISLKLPKIPGRIIGQALTFFRKVFERYKSEAYLQLYYSPVLNQYRLWCPKQEVSFAGVDYDRADQFEYTERTGQGEKVKEVKQGMNWNMAGTIHSHCDFSAYHSGTDTGDEASFNGIHVTLGHVNRKEFSMCSSVAVNNHRVKMDPENCCLGVSRLTNRQIASSPYMTWGDSQSFVLDLSEEDAQGLVQDTEVIEEEWMPKVTKRNYGMGFGGGWQEWGGWRGGGSKKNDAVRDDNFLWQGGEGYVD